MCVGSWSLGHRIRILGVLMFWLIWLAWIWASRYASPLAIQASIPPATV